MFPYDQILKDFATSQESFLINISQLPSTIITSFKASVTEENNPDPDKYTVIHMEYTIAQVASSTNPRYVAVFLGSSAEVSGDNYEQQFNLNYGSYDFKIDKQQGGTRLYAIDHAIPVSCNGYYDYNLSTYVNSCLGPPSEKIEIVVP